MKGILKGLSTTFSTFTRRAVTVQYPETKRQLPERQRSFPVLLWDFDHEEPYCTGCMVCVRNCPVDCMTAVMVDNPQYATGMSNRRKIIDKFWIDYGRCMRCNICIEVCNFEAIVMDNQWTGHEHATFDRRDLHLDLDDLLVESKSGRLVEPFRPIDDISLNIAKAEGEEIPDEAMQGARPAARLAQADRVAQGLPAGTKERDVEPPPEAETAAVGASAGGVDEEIAALTPNKLRARRMKAERAVKAVQADGADATPELLNDLRRYGSALYKEITGEDPADPSKPAAPASSATAPAAAAAPAGNIGDPNSPRKIRARRIRAEREAKPLMEAGETVPDDLLERLRSGQSALYKEITGNDPAAATAAQAAEAPAAAAPTAGAAGDPNSERKVRARRMRAVRQAKEVLSRGEEIPQDLAQTIIDAGGEVPTAGDD